MRKQILSIITMLFATLTANTQTLVSENVFKDITTQQSVLDTRRSRPTPAGKYRQKGKPIVFYIGDSTVRNGTNGDGWNQEWGFALFAQEWLDEDKVVVENHGVGGLSSRTYYNQEWAKVKAAIQEGDYVVIDFGHNDSGSLWDYRSTISGTGTAEDTTMVVINRQGVEETVYSFGQYLRFFIDETIALGATPIICSLTPRADLTTGKAKVGESYRIWGQTIAEEKGIAFIDLNKYAVEMYNKFSTWKVNQLYHGGNLHTNLLGAWHNAYAHALSIAENESNPLRQYLKETLPAKLNIKRTDNQPYTFTVGGSGTSARDVYRSGQWGLIYNTIEEGDTVKLHFGESELASITNDGELGCIQSAKDSVVAVQMTATGRWATVGTYGWYIRYFMNDIEEKGAIGVLVNDINTPPSVETWNKELTKADPQLFLLYTAKQSANVTIEKASSTTDLANYCYIKGGAATITTLADNITVVNANKTTSTINLDKRTNTHDICITLNNGNTMKAGDIITFAVSTDGTTTIDGAVSMNNKAHTNATNAVINNTGTDKTLIYTIQEGDEICGRQTFYVKGYSKTVSKIAYISITRPETTAIRNVSSGTPEHAIIHKICINGKLIINVDGSQYNTSGMRIR